MQRRRPGRPAEFRKRAKLNVFLEAAELRALYAAAESNGVSASRFARALIIAGLARRPTPRLKGK